MSPVLCLSFDAPRIVDNTILIRLVDALRKSVRFWRVDCFTASETYLNTEIDSTLSPESLIALLAESQKAIFIRLLGQSEPQTHTFIDSLRDFVQSDCSICMLCVDSAYYDIYTKQDITPFEHVLADFPCEHIETLSGSEITRETMLV